MFVLLYYPEKVSSLFALNKFCDKFLMFWKGEGTLKTCSITNIDVLFDVRINNTNAGGPYIKRYNWSCLFADNK